MLHSEIVYAKPSQIAFSPWMRQTDKARLETETSRSRNGTSIRVWAENLRAIPDEDYSFPFVDLSSRIMIVPTAMSVNGVQISLLDTWRSAVQLFEDESYASARRRGKPATKHAKALAGQGSPAERAQKIYAFVRDEVRTDAGTWVGLSVEGVEEVFDDRHGTAMDKALLLQTMLRAVKLDARLVWAADRDAGRVDLEVANPAWFDRGLVLLDLGGRQVFLDPSDPSLGFGHLAPVTEGMPGLVLSKRDPEVITLPESDPGRHVRRAVVALEIDAAGRVRGTGTIEAHGHYAWTYLRWGDDAEKTRDHWLGWLEDRLPDFTVDEVTVEEDLDAQVVRIGWSVEQNEEAVLGDEASLTLSRPLGPADQLFSVPQAERITPVQFTFSASRNEVETRVRWPEGWSIDVLPNGVDLESSVGAIATRFEPQPDGRSLVYHRTLVRSGREHLDAESYILLRQLYGSAEENDEQSLVLLRD